MWKKLNKWLSSIVGKEQILTLIVSIIALTVAVRSCIVSEHSTAITEYDISTQRLMTLTAEVSNDSNFLKIKPNDNTLILLKASAVYPKAFDETEWPIDPPDHILYVIVAKNHIRELIKKNFPSDPNYHQLIPDASIPIIINTEYIAKGVKYFDRSLYWLNYRVFIIGDGSSLPEITFKGLLFQGHLGASENSFEILSRLWSKIEQSQNELRQSKTKVTHGKGNSLP